MTTKTDTAKPTFQDARNAKANADGSANILRFGGGLMLWVQASGLKTWRYKVQRDGKSSTLNLGHFPAMSIREAEAARMKLRTSVDPARERRDDRAKAEVADATTFRLVAERWAKAVATKHRWTDGHRVSVHSRLALHVYPKLGERPVGEITAADVQDLITALHEKAPAVAVAVKQYVSRALDFAAAHDLILFNPAAKIRDYLPTRLVGEETPRAYVRTIEDARRVLAAVEARASTLNPTTVLLHRFLALTAVRKRELLGARWSEVDFEAAVWTVPAERMKGRFGQRQEHRVALAPQAIEVLRAAERLRAGEFIFPSAIRGAALIERSTINAVMTRALRLAGLGQVMCPHGWRGTFSTIMNEVDPSSFRVVDVMLAHKHFRDSLEARGKASVEGRYNHATYQSARHRIAALWADMLLDGAPDAFRLIGLEAPKVEAVEAPSNVVALADRRVA